MPRFYGEASFQEDGRQWTLVLDAQAIIEIEGRLSASLSSVFDGGGEPQLSQSALVLAGMLQRHHAGITQEEALDMLLGVPEARPKMQEAIEMAMVTVNASAEGNAASQPQRKSGTGKRR